MKRLLLTLLLILAGTAHAAFPPQNTQQGGTGWGFFTQGTIPIGPGVGSSALRFATSTGFTFSTSTNNLVFTYGSTTGLTNTGTSWLSGFISSASSTISSALRLSTLTSGTLQVGTDGLVYKTATSAPSVSAPITYSGTLGFFLGGTDGSFGCTSASSGVTGCLTGTDWDTFNNKQATISVTAPIRLLGATIDWTGLATTSQPSSSNVLVSNGGAGVYGVGTSTLTASGVVQVTNSPVIIGGSSAAITIVGGSNGQLLAWGNGVPAWTSTSSPTSPITWTPAGGYACSTCLTANETITLTGAVTGSGSTAITTAFGTMAQGVLANPASAATIPTANATSSLYGVAPAGGQVLGWSNITGGIAWIATSSTAGDTPGGSGTELQYRAGASTLGAVAGSAFDSSTGILGLASTSPWAQLSVNPIASAGTRPQFVVGSSTETTFIVDSDFDVGLSTTSPFAKLSIQGRPGASSYLLAVGTTSASGAGTAATSTLTVAVDSNGNFFGGLAPRTYVSVGSSSPWAALSVDSSSFGTTTTSSALFAVGSSSRTALSVHANGKVGVASTSPWGLFSIGPEALTTGNAPEFAIGTSSSVDFVVDAKGYAGVGTTSPFANLSAQGLVGQPTWLFGVATSTTANVGTSSLVVGVDKFGNLLAGLSPRTVVGIGTTSPNALLSIDTSATTTGGILAIGSSTIPALNINQRSFAGFGSTTPWGHVSINPLVSDNNAPALVIGSSTASQYVFLLNGRAGFASTSPWAKLSIQGTVSQTFPLFAVSSTTTANVGTSTTLWSIDSFGNFFGNLSQRVRFTLGSSSVQNAAFSIDTTATSTRTFDWLNIGSTSSGTLFKVSAPGFVQSGETDVGTASSTTFNLDWGAYKNAILYRHGFSATTFTFINATTSQYAGTRHLITICNPGGTAGAITIRGCDWAGGTAYTQTTTANSCDVISAFVTQATSTLASPSYRVFCAANTGFARTGP